MAVRNHRSEFLPGVLVAHASADAVAWRLETGPEGLAVVIGAGAQEALARMPFAAFARWFHADDRAALHQFLQTQAGTEPGASPGQPVRILCRMRWEDASGEMILTCLEADDPAQPAQGRMVRLDTAVHTARQTLERVGITPTSCWSVEPATGRLIVAPSWKERLGYAPADLEPFTHAAWAQMSHPDDVAGFDSAAVQGRIARGEMVQYISRSRHRDGSWVSFLSFCRAVRWTEAGETALLVGCDLDMTALATLEGALARERDRLTSLLEALPSGKIVLDAGGRIVFCNPEASGLLACGPGAALGQRLLDLLVIEAGRDELCAALADPEGVGPLRLKTMRARKPLMLQADVVVLPGEGGARQMLVSLNDITPLHALQMQLEQSIDNARFIATHDLMTGLPDRFLLLRLLGEQLTRMQAEGHPLAVLGIDFDNFRLINDTLGHETADQLIKSAAKRLEQGLPDGAVLARMGEGEFVVLLPGADRLGAEARAWEIVRSFARPMRLARRQCFLTVSIGIGLFPVDGRCAEDMLRNADMAMHQSKSRGRNTVTLFSPEIGAQYERRTAVAQALHRALEDSRFELYLQPKFEVGTAVELVGAEALLRLTDAELGAISPAEFIPVAEVDGLVAAIDLEVMRLAGALVTGWAARGIDLPIAVNLASTTLDEPGHADLADRLLRAGLDPRRVTIELTETGLAMPVERHQRNLRRLRDAGYKIAVDDFGTGQSALGALQTLPVAEIKIDRSFVMGLDGAAPESARAIVRAILAMARALGLRAIAEGVETEAQFEVLRAEGCTTMQGFLLGRPIDLHSFEARHLAHRPRSIVPLTSAGGGVA